MGRNDTKPYPFEGWTARQVNYVLSSIGKNIPADECEMKLNEAQKELYEEMRADLARENEKYGYDPWIIGYDLMELETE